ncbi:CHAP domain-containing protein [bacterium]|nr:CHAP domain-containing protein [bacterium]
MNSINGFSNFANGLSSFQGLGVDWSALTGSVNVGALTADSVNLTAQAANLTGTTATSGAKNAATENAGDYGKFTETFTKENIASLLGLDVNNLSEQESKDLQELLYNLNTANAEREANGEAAMTKDELNAFLKDEINKNKNGEQSSLGKSLSDLGIDELSDQQFKNITDALNAYNKGNAAEEEKKAEEQQKNEQPQQAQDAGEAGGANGAGGAGGPSGAGGAGGARGAGGATGVNDATKMEEQLPEDLNELQQMKSDAEGELGDIKNQIDDKKGQINERKEQIAKEALEGKTDIQDRKALREYDEAKKEYDEANKAKQAAQQDLTKVEQENCANEQALYANANAKSQNASELSSAQSELASLQPPTPPSGDDEDGSAQAAYEAELAAYEAQKSELESKISSLEQEKAELETEFQELEQKKQELAQTKADKENEIKEQDDIMQKAQQKMDEVMQKLSEDNPEVKEALENDEELKALEADVEELNNQVTEKEEDISKIDEKISAVEAQDQAVQDMREEEADQAFQKAAEEAGADIAGSIENAQETVAQDKYGKAYDELTEDEKRAIEVEIDGEVTTSTMEWAKEELQKDPNNQAAQEVLEKGQANLDAQQDNAFCSLSHAVETMPNSMRDGASEAMEKAIEEAEANGEDANLAATKALSDYVNQNADNPDLSDEERAALNDLGVKTDAYSKTLERNNEGYEMLVDAGLAEADETRKAASAETSALYAQVKTGAMSQNIADMITAMESMLGLHEGNSADAARINEITGKSGINCSTTPWCAAFAMNMLKDYGVLDSSSCANINYCPEIRNWASQQGLWEGNGNGYAPQAGDAILFDWSHNGTAQHIGVVTNYDPETGTIYTIEGNSSDSVAARTYNINSADVMGFINCAKQNQ